MRCIPPFSKMEKGPYRGGSKVYENNSNNGPVTIKVEPKTDGQQLFLAFLVRGSAKQCCRNQNPFSSRYVEIEICNNGRLI